MSIWCDRTVTGGLLFLILFTPFAFGSVHPWAFGLMEALLFLLVIVWMAKLTCLARRQKSKVGGQSSSVTGLPSSSDHLAPLALPLAVFIALALFQLVPLPPSWLRVLSPQTHQLYTQSLPGWPERMLWENPTPNTPNPAPQPTLLPTLNEVRGGAAVPFEPSISRATTPEVTSEKSGVGNQRSEIGGQGAGGESDGRDQKSEIRNHTSYLRSLVPETWFPLSVSPSLTQTDLLKIAAYAALFFLVWLYPLGESWQLVSKSFVYNGLRQVEERFTRSLVLVVLLTGLLVAVTGFVQRFSWNGKILWFFLPYDWATALSEGVPRASGPFINPDHFANYLLLIFPMALACALFRTPIMSKPLEHALRMLCALAAFLLATGILLSLSRSGWIGALLGVVILLWFSPWHIEQVMPALFKKRGTPLARISLMIICSVLLVSLLFVGAGGREQVDARLGETVTKNAGLWGRTVIWKDSLTMVRDFPLFGVGLGAWPELFPRYRRAPWSADFYREAHNDYVELLAETGIIGFGLLAWFFFQAGRLLLRGVKTASAKYLPVTAAIIAALGAMAFHELLDFSLQIPANAFLFTLLFALALRVSSSIEPGAQSREQGRGRLTRFITPNVSRLSPVLFGAAALVLLVVAVRQEQIPYPYNFKQPASVAEARELIVEHPARAAAHMDLLQLLQGKASPATELQEIEAALWLEPVNPYLRDLRAALLLRTGKSQEGLDEITRSVQDSPSFSTHFYLRDRLFPWLSAKEKVAVEDGLKQALDRSYPTAEDSLGEFYAKLGRFADQAALYEKAALEASDPGKKIDLQLKAGAAYARVKDEAMAEKLLRQVISTNRDDPRPYQQLVALIYAPRKDLGSAKATVEEGIKNGAPAFSLYLALAEAAHSAGSSDDRRAALSSAKYDIQSSTRREQDPYSRYLLLADGASKAQDREAEKAALAEALRFKPRSSNVLHRLANLYMQERDFDRAAFYYIQLANINRNSADTFYQLAVAEESRYGFAAADKAFARAVALAPDKDEYRERYEGLKARVAQNRKPNG